MSFQYQKLTNIEGNITIKLVPRSFGMSIFMNMMKLKKNGIYELNKSTHFWSHFINPKSFTSELFIVKNAVRSFGR